jgi:hypothetical protein
LLFVVIQQTAGHAEKNGVFGGLKFQRYLVYCTPPHSIPFFDNGTQRGANINSFYKTKLDGARTFCQHDLRSESFHDYRFVFCFRSAVCCESVDGSRARNYIQVTHEN